MTQTYTRRTALAFAGMAGLTLLASIAGRPRPGMAAGKPEIHVDDAWARASIGDLDRSAAYFTIMNHGDTADRLLAASTPASEKTELHTTIRENDVMRMRALADGVEVPAGGAVEFAPGGNHVMLIGLKEPLKEGDGFPMTLTFEKAGEMTIEVAVKKDAGPDSGGHMHHHKH